jgi:dTDP-4-amino-4,6-dideoxygalactose transaminase
MGSIGAFSIYSLRKQLPVPDGGVLIVNDSEMKKNMGDPRPPTLHRISLKRWLVTYLKRFAFAIGWPNIIYWIDILRKKNNLIIDPFYRHLSDTALFKISYVTLQVLGQIDIRAIARVRRKNYCYMSEQLSGLREVIVPFPSLPNGAIPQAFPVLLKDAGRVCSLMRKKGIDTWRWPGYNLPKSISRTDFPGTFSWADSLLLFPLHQDLNNVHIDKVIKTLKNYL